MLMPTVFTWLLRYIGWPGILLVVFYVYEEGIPGAHRVPFLTSIPVIGDLTTGRVHSHAAEQVRLATKNMVTRFERDALAAQLAEERSRALAATKAAEEFSKRYAAQLAANKRNLEKAEQDIAEDNRNEDGAPRVTGDDIKWIELRNR